MPGDGEVARTRLTCLAPRAVSPAGALALAVHPGGYRVPGCCSKQGCRGHRAGGDAPGGCAALGRDSPGRDLPTLPPGKAESCRREE